MATIDVLASEGTFADERSLAKDRARAVMRLEAGARPRSLPREHGRRHPRPCLHRQSRTPLAPATTSVSKSSHPEPGKSVTESTEGGQGINGHAITGADMVEARRAEIAGE
ncbi:MAG: hypothetical protein JWP14_2844 [Frankiales bacterium]|jgi:hypothetical protein|nr:hypothetical protein [Frankiales bacterium]